ncbi:response regulator transcription factor [Candidatus Bipolaricaulota bacterium]|nr:response regulator transcription factor [Candidatus Bipolaricaulota bacterium]
MSERILVVDDESAVRDTIRTYLEAAGFEILTAADGPTAVIEFERSQPCMVILDWMLPGMDGLAVAHRLRQSSNVPIIMLTARVEEGDRIEGLEAGADDYVVKPFSARELEARVRAVLRRAAGDTEQEATVEVGQLFADVGTREARLNGESVELTAMEFDLLVYLMRHAGRVFTRLELLEALRGSTHECFERAIDSHIKRLRRKIEPDPKEPTYIQTVFGVGYRFSKDGHKR